MRPVCTVVLWSFSDIHIVSFSRRIATDAESHSSTDSCSARERRASPLASFASPQPRLPLSAPSLPPYDMKSSLLQEEEVLEIPELVEDDEFEPFVLISSRPVEHR